MKAKIHKSWQRIRASVSDGLKNQSQKRRFRHNEPTAKEPKPFKRLHHRAKQKYQEKGAPFLLFAKEIFVNPRAIGAACPSSKYLGNAMAAQVQKHQSEGLVIELGGGTGTITRALLDQGIAPERLVTVEQSAALAAHLRHQFPHIRVIEGDACQLKQLLGRDAKKVQAVVSGLPLRSLPQPVVRAIMQQVHHLLPEGGIFVQFTYNLRSPSTNQAKYLSHIDTQMVWQNFPPARVDTFSRSATQSTLH